MPKKYRQRLAVILLCATGSVIGQDTQPRRAPSHPPVRVAQAAPADTGNRNRDQDPVSRRVAVDRRVATSIDRAEQLLKENEYDVAFNTLHTLLIRPSVLVYSRQHGYETTVDRINRILSGLSPELKRQYELRFGPLATRMLDAALQKQTRSAISDVASRFFQTNAGFRAANILATMHLDAGDMASAYRWMVRLNQSDAPLTKSAEWQLRFAVVEQALTGKQPELTGETVLNGNRVSASEWLSANRLPRPSDPPLENWMQFSGNAARSGYAAGSDPLLVKRWSRAATNNPTHQTNIDLATATIVDGNLAAVPAGMPVAVNGRIIFRTLRGATVVDAGTGAIQFETRENESYGLQRLSPRTRNQSPTASLHGFGSHMYRNGVWGFLACDEQRVYVIERHELFGQQASVYSRSLNAQQMRLKTNQLTAYDLTFGTPVWNVGGPATNESFELPLAGHFFFGPPAVADNTAFLIGEKDGEVRLCVLDVESGTTIWSVVLAYPDTPIERDPVRRNWPAQAAIAEGMIVCPTTLGWLIAVDQFSQSIQWMQQVATTQRSTARLGGRVPETRVLKLNERWLPSAPIISNGRVVFAPTEGDQLLCLQLNDGKKLWSRTKADSQLYVAGVRDSQVLIVGRNKVTALDLESGDTRWDVPLDAFPSGRGALTAESMFTTFA